MDTLLNLKAEAVRRKVRQRDVALRLGISPSRLSDIFNGYSPIDSDYRKRIEAAINELSPIQPGGSDAR